MAKRGRCVAAAAAAVLAPFALVTIGSGNVPPPEPEPPAVQNAASGALNATAVPNKKLIPWIQAAGSICPTVTPALIAAQIEAESNWQTSAISSANAQGISQFLPATFAAIGKDENDNGIASPFDPPDAIMAQGRYMCQITQQVSDVPGDPQKNLLAAYNTGPYAVTAYNGIPPYTETRTYVQRITGLLAKYTAPNPASGGNCRAPILGDVVLGTPMGQVGSAWSWYGRHTGQDYVAGHGTRIVAACDGTIADIQNAGAYGQHVIIDHGSIDGHQITSLYAHMSAFGQISVGQTVNAGDVIGYIGNTGNSFGPHLHMEIRQDFSPTGPFSQFLDPPTFIQEHSGPPAGATTDNADTDTVAAVIKAAKSQLGVPYSWAGGTLTGPSEGIAQGAGTVGWDCSSLVRYAWHQGTDGNITLSRLTYDQINDPHVKPVPRNDIQPGDLIFFQTASQGADWSHVGLYIGHGKMIEAPRTGSHAKITGIESGYYARQPQAVRRVITQ